MGDTVLVIGAGAAGLMAARDLSAAGLPVIVLEASARPGGRIRTLHVEGISRPIEAGAEFIHGNLPLTMQLLKEAGINYQKAIGGTSVVKDGKWVRQDVFSGHWAALMQRMEALGQDIPVAEFLASSFPEEQYTSLRDAVRRFAEGYDLADIRSASTLALYREWSKEAQAGYRVRGGYGRLIDHLERICLKNGARILCSSVVSAVEWSDSGVEVFTPEGASYKGSKLIITASLGVLQFSAVNDGKPAIAFSPGIPGHLQAASRMGFGTVTKILMEFDKPLRNREYPDTSFVLSNESIPTWWTSLPLKDALLTGWLSGSARQRLGEMDEQALIDRGLDSLASIYGLEVAALRHALVKALALDWAAEPFVRGGYSFETVETPEARKVLRRPIAGTLFFAGEALYEGPVPGTVEAALVSGREVAARILSP